MARGETQKPRRRLQESTPCQLSRIHRPGHGFLYIESPGFTSPLIWTVKPVGILHEKADVAPAAGIVESRVQSAALKLALHPVGIPVVDLIRDVVYFRTGGSTCLGMIARYQRSITKAERALAFSVIASHLHPQEIRIEVASFVVIGDLVRDVIECNGRESSCRVRVARRKSGSGAGRESHSFG